MASKKQRAHEQYLTCYLSGKARLNLEKRVNGLTQQGILADWGYAVPIPSPDTVHTPDVVHPNDPSIPLAESDPPTLPIEPPVSDSPTKPWAEFLAPTNLVPIRQIGRDHGVSFLTTYRQAQYHAPDGH